MKRLAVPYARQEAHHLCGPASLQMILGFFGVAASQAELAKEVGANEKDGTRRTSLVAALEKRGFAVHGGPGASVSDLKGWIEEGAAVIVNYIEPSEEEGHYATVVGADEGRVIMNDPWNGEGFAMDEGEFLARWRGAQEKGDRWAIAALPA